MLASAFSATPPVSTSRLGAGCAQQMVDDMDQRVLEHELGRRGLVEAIPGVGPVMDILDPQHRIGIPQLLGLERLAEDLDQRGRGRDCR